MKSRPLCSLCLVIAVFIGTLTAGAGAKFIKELRQSPVEKYGEKDDWLIVRGQVYKKEEKEKYQVLYLKNCSIHIQKYQENQANQEDRKGQKSFIKESRILVYDEEKKKIQIGNEVEAEGKLNFFENARNPGNFDQKEYYRRQNIHGKVWSESLRITDDKVRWIKNALENLRSHWKKTLIIEAGEKNGSILSAILLGEKSQMDSDTKKLYQVNGIGHILAISGLHLSVIGIGIYSLLRKLTGSYTIGGAGGIFFFFLYVLMIGVTVSVIRAGIMYLFRVGAEIAGRHYDSITALAVAAAVVMLWRPLSIYDGAFWLSFLAVFAIIVVMPSDQNMKEKERQKEERNQGNIEQKAKSIQKNKIKGMLKSNIEMQLFLLPVVLYYFYEFPLYATFLNLLVIPLMTVLLSLGIFGSFVCMLCSGAWKMPGTGMLTICSGILNIYEKCCAWMLELPGARMVIGRPEIWQVLFYYGCAAFICVCNISRKRQKQGIVMTVCVWSFGLLVLLHRFESPSQMQVAVLDVGQGDGIFLKSPGGMTCMIDGGSSDVKNVGQYRIEPYLLSKGVGCLDYVFISHGDSDHMNGIEEMIIRQKIGVKIGTLVFPEKKVWDESMKDLAALAEKYGVRVTVMKQGKKIREKNKMEVLCLGPGSDYSGESGNGASMVLAVGYRNFDFLFTGDVEGEGEEKLCEAIERYCPERTFEVLKAAHHGSRNSSVEAFLKQVRPKYTIISAGVENSYGHPHRETIERLRKNGSRIWNTANCGGIEITVEFGGKIQYTLKEGSEYTAYEESE